MLPQLIETNIIGNQEQTIVGQNYIIKEPHCYMHEVSQTLFWYDDNHNFHNEIGPAIIYGDDWEARWWLHGQEYTFEEWLTKVNISLEEQVLLKLRYL